MFCDKTLATGFTFVWFVSRVKSFMSFQISNIAKPLVTVFTFVFKLPARLKHLSQVSHLYGFSPVWDLSCAFKVPVWLKHLSQVLHL